jgi:L-ascorbate metabolism protein UlaG (beta-lactamase superfamily)
MSPRPRRRLRAASRGLALFAALAVVLVWLSTERFRAFGGAPGAASLARMQASPRFVDGQFKNDEPTTTMAEGALWGSLKEWATGGQMRSPICPLEPFAGAAGRLARPPESGLRVTWLGHSTALVEVDGAAVLTDPVWSERASPSGWVGPRRFHPPPLALADLPRLDAVVVSHEHYDHLDMNTVKALAARGVPFHVPLGMGGHLDAWGVPASQIVEHDWWQAAELPGGRRVVATPARHFNGRGPFWRPGALWASWAITGPRHRVFFSGDTGLTEAFREIAKREGPFDVALLEIGQYHPSWGDIHLGPIGALDAQAMLGAGALLPVHWATFELGYHAWSEPAETLAREAERRGVPLLTPRLGEPVEPALRPATAAWWRPLPPLAPRCP